MLPLNNQSHFSRYNGGKEKGTRDLKTALGLRQWRLPIDVALAAKVSRAPLELDMRRFAD